MPPTERTRGRRRDLESTDSGVGLSQVGRKVTIKVLTSGKSVQIDGLHTSRV